MDFQFNRIQDRKEHIQTENKEELIQTLLIRTHNQTLPNF